MVKKVIKRSVKKERKTFYAINFLIFLTVMISVISLLSFTIGYDNFQKYKDEANMEDYRFTTMRNLTNDEEVEIEDEFNIDIESQDYTVINKNNYEYTVKYKEENNVSKYLIQEGTSDISDGEVIISESYANANGLKIGDKIDIDGNDYNIAGFAFFVEDGYPIKNGSLFPENKNVSSIITTENDFNKITNGSYNTEYLLKLTDESDIDYINDNIGSYFEVELPKMNILGQITNVQETQNYDNILSLTKYSENFKVGVVEIEYLFVSLIFGAITFIIGIITVVLSIFLFKNIVNRQKREIGILRAVGVKRNEIINEYSKIFTKSIVIVIILSLIVGIFSFIGFNNFLKEFFNIYKQPIEIIDVISLVLFLIVESLILIISVRIFAIRGNLSQDILLMIKNIDKDSKVNKKSFKIFKGFKNNLKINTIIRNKGKTLILVYGIIFSTVLIVFAFTMLSAFSKMQENYLGEDFTYGFEAVYSPQFQTDPEEYDENSAIYFSANLNDDNKTPVTVVAYNENNQYININDGETLNDGEVYITQKLASDNSIKIGDELTIENQYDQSEKYNFEVKEFASNEIENKIFVNIKYIQNLLDLPDDYYNAVISKGEIKEEISQGDNDIYYYSVEDLINGMNEYSTLVNVVIIYLSLMATVISFIVLIIITNLIVKSNEKTISIMKVLGYTNKEIYSLILSGYRMVVLVTYLLMFPLAGKGVGLYLDLITSLVEDFDYPLVLEVNFTIFIVGLVLIMGTFELTSYLSKRKINKINLSESLKIDE